uniref:Uncharacterized protein n=1 Tax=Ralstonia solanacearum TaxID=305 RepID=A0A0S4VBX0_RALSL|nr:protein of unknown function [Ralstonia solanacearum]
MIRELLQCLLKLKGLSAAMSEQVLGRAMAATAAQIREEVGAVLWDFDSTQLAVESQFV